MTEDRHVYGFDARIQAGQKYWKIQIPQPTVAKIVHNLGNDALELPVEVKLRFIE